MYDASDYLPAQNQVSLLSTNQGSSAQQPKRIHIVTPAGPAGKAKKGNKRQASSIVGQMPSGPKRGKSKKKGVGGGRRGPKKGKKGKKGGVAKRRKGVAKNKQVTIFKGKASVFLPSGRKKTVALTTLVKQIPAATVVRAASSVRKKKRRT